MESGRARSLLWEGGVCNSLGKVSLEISPPCRASQKLGALRPCSGHCPRGGDLPHTRSVQSGNLYTSPLFIRGRVWALKPHEASTAQPLNKPWLSFSFYSQTGIISLYDCVFKRNPGYNQKLHRDDREHAKSLGLHVNEEVIVRRGIAGCEQIHCVCLFSTVCSWLHVTRLCEALLCLTVPGSEDQATVTAHSILPC